MTTPIPEHVRYCTLRWTTVGYAEDGIDTGKAPDAAQVNGTITIFADIPFLKYIGDGSTAPVTILSRPTTFQIVNGKLKNAADNTVDVLVVASVGQPAGMFNPSTDWTYTAEWELNDGYSFGSFSFEAPADSVVDLTLVTPTISSQGVPYIQGPAGKGFNFKGAYADGVNYYVDDVVTRNGATFLVRVDHSSSSLTAPTQANPGSYFVLLAAKGDQGVQGTQGPQGTAGTNATITGATATGLAAGSSPTVAMGGTSSARTFAFGIPAGATGPQGIQGVKGDTGNTGPAGTITGATAAGLAAGAAPTVTLGGTPEARTFAFGIPKGDTGAKGDTGNTGATGPAGTITGATATGLAAGAAPTVALGGTPEARTFAFGIPKGDKGDKGDQGLPGAGAPDATTTSKGSVQLAGHLGGTAAAPEVLSGAGHTHTRAQISDASAIGRTVLGAADAAAVRTAIGAGTSNLALGTTAGTAKAGDYAPAVADITGSTVVGRSLLSATDAAAARASIGAGTSNLALGTTAGTAKEGTYQPTAANISDSSVVGRAVLTALDAAAARTAIGAGTSNLALGTTSTTAKAGNYAPPDATSTTKGLNRLTNHLGGTADAPTVVSGAGHGHTASQISDASVAGRSVLTAADVAAIRSQLGVMPSIEVTRAAYDAGAKTPGLIYYIVG